MGKRLKILLYADSYGGRVGTSEPYVDFLGQFGEIILVSPQNDLDTFLELGDVLAMPGGADVDSKRYNERPVWAFGRTNPHYEYLDTTLLPAWIKTNKPIIGICRGMQSLNVALGGNLIQHIIGHIGGKDRFDREDTIYTKIPGYPAYEVNSYHHQAVGKLGEGVKVLGWGQLYSHCPGMRDKSKIYGGSIYMKDKKSLINKWDEKNKYYCIPEIIGHETQPYLGFQYHPEEFNCELAVKLIGEMLSKAYPNRFTVITDRPKIEEESFTNVYVS